MNPVADEKSLQVSVTQRGVLDPLDRFSEIIFGLIMALTFTGTISVGEAGRLEVRSLLVAALGCNLAWGLVDAVMFVISRSSERIRNLEIGRLIADSADNETAFRHLKEVLPEPFDRLLGDAGLEHVVQKIRGLPRPTRKPLVLWADLRGALAVFLLVSLSTVPVSLPFLFVDDVKTALRISNLVAAVSLFLAGASLAYFSKQNPWLFGLATVAVGIVLILITIALGG
ncbi:MAG: VIT1/CCC1 transporter family protein [Deltaproteobacteria bacterium]|nr:VIT1/CCC1 transporter family protein [Deltaproteobacteria bacterium]